MPNDEQAIANSTTETPAAQPSASVSYESATQADAAFHHGTFVGDYHSQQQLHADTPTQHLDTGSETHANGHYTNLHDFDAHAGTSSYFNFEDHNGHVNAFQEPAAQHHLSAFDTQHGGHQPSAFDHAGHDSGAHGGHHDSGHTDHGGSHSDHGSAGVSH